MRGRLLVLIMGGVLLGAPAAAQAADTASVVNGIVVVQGDGSANQLNFAEGANDPNTHYQYGAAIWDSAPGESVSAGQGCITGDPAWDHPVVECSGFGPTAIVVNGNGGDDTITNQEGLWWGPGSFCNDCDTYFTTITVTGGDGNDSIYPLADNDQSGSTVAVNGGAGNDSITIGSQADSASKVTFYGGDGNDTITGDNQGLNLAIDGGAGDDNIKAGQGTDTITGGPGSDTISGGEGNDTIRVYDGQRDSVDCDILGNDVVYADQYDAANKTDCAAVHVTNWGPQTKISLSLPASQHPVKNKRILATVGCSTACYTGAYAEVKVGQAKPFQVDSEVFHLSAAGRRTIPLAFSRHQESLLTTGLRAGKRVVATVFGVLTDASGKVTAQSSPATLRISS